MKEVMYGYKSDIIGLFWLSFALFLSLALGSYYPLDPSFNSVSTLSVVLNKCGFLGSFLADFLYQFFGFSSWGFVLLSLRQSMKAFQRNLIRGEWKENLGILSMGLLVSSSLLELHKPGKIFFQGHIYSGGIIGHGIITSVTPYLHYAGLILVFWSLALMFCLVVTKNSIKDLCAKILDSLKTIYFINLGILLFIGKNIFKKLPLFCRAPLAFMLSFMKSKTEAKQESSTHFISDKKDLFFQEEKTNKEFQEEEDLKRKELLKSSFKSTNWKLPSINLLTAPAYITPQTNSYESRLDADRLQKKLQQFSIAGEITKILSGPFINLFEFKPEDNVKIARITQMEDDLMIALKSKSVRIIAPIPGRDVVGIEADHSHKQTVYLKSLINDPSFSKNYFALPLILGRYVDGRPAVHDLGKIPHLMVAGSTGSGKSVFVVSFLLSLLFRHTPDTLRLLLVDPKQVDLSMFKGLPHLLAAPVRESKQAVVSLQWCLNEMHKRYRSLARFYTRNLEGFNERTKKLTKDEIKKHTKITQELSENSEENYYFSPQPYICIVLEEFGDLMNSPERNHVENLVVRLAQMARACGMHLILSMQSPRKDVVTGLIKTNIPGRISFKVSSRIDSRIILDEGGAERLLSQGDMLYLGPGYPKPERFHGPFVKENEILSVVNFWKQQVTKDPYIIKFSSKNSSMDILNEDMSLNIEDQKYTEISSYVSDLKEVSASLLQRKYGLGYPRAARLIDRLEEKGMVGPPRGSKPREVLTHK